MKTDVIINYRDRGDPDRREAFKFVWQWWHEREGIIPPDLGSITIHTTDNGHPDYSRGGSFNQAVKSSKAEVCVLTNADVIPRLPAVLAAILLCHHGERRTVYPFDRYIELTRPATSWMLDHPGSIEHRVHPFDARIMMPADHPPPDASWMRVTTEHAGRSVGPILVTRRDAWRQAWGMDPRFTGWGFEDAAWHHHSTLAYGPSLRVMEHDCLHLYHDPDPHSYANPDSPIYGRNLRLCERYEQATTLAAVEAIRREVGRDVALRHS